MRMYNTQLAISLQLLLLAIIAWSCESTSNQDITTQKAVQEGFMELLPTDTLEALLYQAHQYYRKAQLDSALLLYQRIEKQPVDQLNGKGRTLYWQALAQQVEEVHFSRRALDGANVEIGKLLKYSKEWFGKRDSLVAKAYLLKGAYLSQNQQADSLALAYIDTAYTISQASFGEDGKEMIPVLLAYSNQQHLLGNTEEALQFANKVLSICSQINNQQDPYNADAYFSKALAQLEKREIDAAKKNLHQAKAIYESIYAKEHPKIGQCYLELASIAFSNGDYPKTHEFLDTALVIFQKSIPENSMLIGKTYYKEGFVFHDEFEFEKAISSLEKAIEHFKQSEGFYMEQLGNAYAEITNSYSLSGNYRKAIEYAEKNLELRKQYLQSPHIDIVIALTRIGSNSRYNGEIEKAADYLERAARELEALYGKDHSFFPIIHHHLGMTYANMEKFELSLAAYKEGLRNDLIFLGKDHHYISDDYNNLSIAYRDLQDYEMAEKMLDSSLMIINALPESKQRLYKLTISQVGYAKIAEAKGDLDGYLFHLRKSLELDEKVYGKRHPDSAQSLLNMIGVFFKQRKYGEIEACVQEINRMLIPDGFDISAMDTMTAVLTAKVYLLEGQKALGDLYSIQADGDLELLKKALNHYRIAISIATKELKKITDRETKDRFLSSYEFLFEATINTALAIFEQTQQQSFLLDAFHLMEQYKATILKERIQKDQAGLDATIPPVLLEQEKTVDVDIAEHEKIMYDERLKESPDEKIIEQQQDSIFQLKRLKDSIIYVLEQEYPEYYAIKYAESVIDLQDLQSDLGNQKAGLMEYFFGDSTVIALCVSPNEVNLEKITLDTIWQQTFDQLLNIINRPPPSSSELKREQIKQNYKELAYQFYQQLIGPFQEQLKDQEELIIIPDGKLSYLPFELLITDDSDVQSYRSLSYLLNKFNIRYEYSIGLLQNDGTPQIAGNGFLGFAPIFDSTKIETSLIAQHSETIRSLNGEDIQFQPLPFTKEELGQIKRITSGKAILEKAATEELFKASAGDYHILHLATHAVFNDEYPDYSFLAFHPEKDSSAKEDQILYAYELFNLPLKAELSVLSACETGVGKIQRGEGIKSLSWAFKYAGCPNIVTSLWKANDQCTSNLMVDFYEGLKQGQGKAMALRQSKLDFLKEAEQQFTHPFYWGTFILIGDNTPIELGGNSWKLWIIGLLGMILVGISYWWLRRRKANPTT